MPASIVLSGLAWSTPDGRPLFSQLDLSFGVGRTGLVGRNGIGKSTLLKLIGGALQPHAGTIAVTGTLGVLRQSVQDSPGETVADLFGATEKLALLRRAEQGAASADDLAAPTGRSKRGSLPRSTGSGSTRVPDTELATLSGGQRTRVALAALVFAEPDFVLLDEPTNNLDRAGRASVIDLLASWSGGAIVVSHDRELLETMDAIVELNALGATRYGGNWSHYRDCKARGAGRGAARSGRCREAARRALPGTPRPMPSARRARMVRDSATVRGAASPASSSTP